MNNAMKMRSLLAKRGVRMSMVDHGLSEDLAEIVLFLAEKGVVKTRIVNSIFGAMEKGIR